MKTKTDNRGDIQVKASIFKAEIDPVAKLHGSTNASSVKLDGARREAKTVQLLCFAGSCDVDSGKYVGEYRFKLGEFADAPATDLNKLPGLNGASNVI